MGSELHVYVGPYARFTVERISGQVPQSHGWCCGRAVPGKFCGGCGKETAREVKTVTNDAIRQGDIVVAIDECLSAMQNPHEGFHVWMPNSLAR